MSSPNPQARIESLKLRLGSRTQELRQQRRWTQRHLAQQLNISQGRVSRIENGDASWTAEEFLLLLQVLNADLSDFVPPAEPDNSLQNALARYGASHLKEDPNAGLSPGFASPRAALGAVLLHPSSERLVTALAPVLVISANHISLPELQYELDRAGVPNRLGWVAENTLRAIDEQAPEMPLSQRLQLRRSVLLLETFLSEARPSERALMDPFDQGVRTEKSLQRLWAEASAVSKRWRIASALQVSDFAQALRDALEHHR